MKNDSLPTLLPGDDALRFRVRWIGSPARPEPVGVQVVRVVCVEGDRVTWTNGIPARGKATPFRHVSARRELISLAGFADLFAPDSRPLSTAPAGMTESGAFSSHPTNHE